MNLQTGIKIPVTASTLPQPDSKCIIRNVPLQISEEEILDYLKQIKVKFVKRFTFKNSSNEMTPGKTVLLHFDSCVAPEVVRLGYLNFETQLYIPKPLRCFKCNRFGLVSANCKCNVRCTACAQNHETKSCTETFLKCSNCGGEHSAASRQCPRYIHEMEIVKIKTVNNISYAEACKRECSRKENNIKINKKVLNSQQHFPSLPTSTGTSPLAVRPPPVAYTNHDNVEIEVQEMDNKALTYKENSDINIFDGK